MDKIKLYVKESYNELVNKVTWPTMAELQNTTIVVLVGSLIITAIVFVMDNIANFTLKELFYQ